MTTFIKYQQENIKVNHRILKIKERINYKIEIETYSQKLFFKEKELNDNSLTIKDYNMNNNDNIELEYIEGNNEIIEYKNIFLF